MRTEPARNEPHKSDADPAAGPLLSDACLRARSAAWWAATRQDPAALGHWLVAQLRGERSAAGRIAQLRDAYATPQSRPHRLLTKIAGQESRHAEWIAELLTARGLSTAPEVAQERYWPAAAAGIRDLNTGAAVGAHAERMRLFRIAAIAADPDAPADVRRVFQRILPEEQFHERAFRALAGGAALRETASGHERGARALGLLP